MSTNLNDLFESMLNGAKPIQADALFELLENLHEGARDQALANLIAKAQHDVQEGHLRCPKCDDKFCTRSMVIEIIRVDRAMQTSNLHRKVGQEVREAVGTTLSLKLQAALESAVPAAMWNQLRPLVVNATRDTLVTELKDALAATLNQTIADAVTKTLDAREQNRLHRRILRRISAL